jgi:putative hemolysin
MILQIIAIIILLMLSAYFSSAETALTTVNPHSMRAMAEDGMAFAGYILGRRY